MKRVFIAFASEDETYRDFLKGQSLLPNSDYEFIDMSVKEPYDEDWKNRVRTRIRGSAGVIVLLSKNSLSASGQKWEIKCAVEEEIPTLGVYIHSDDHSKPSEMAGIRCINWSRDDVAAFINGL